MVGVNEFNEHRAPASRKTKISFSPLASAPCLAAFRVMTGQIFACETSRNRSRFRLIGGLDLQHRS